MKNKEADVLYCGVREDKIKNASPIFNRTNLDLFMHFLKERYSVHLNKDVLCKDAPWTKDPILKKYRFTNIRREQDRETKWLIKNIAQNDFLTYRQKILNIILFRLYNKHETLEIMGAPFKMEGLWTCKKYVEILQDYKKNHKDAKFFTGVFMVSGGLKHMGEEFPKHKNFSAGLPLYKIEKLHKENFFELITMCKSQEEVFKLLSNTSGIGSFLAYQMFVDFTYIKEFPFSENEFTVAGPGCMRGINRVFKDKDGMTYEECLFWLRDNWYNFEDRKVFFDPEEEMVDLKHYDRVMNVMSLENCFCEMSKYIRVYNNEGRLRKTYKPRKEE